VPERGEHDRGVLLGERIIRPERSIVEPYEPSPIGGLRYRRLVRMRPRNIGQTVAPRVVADDCQRSGRETADLG